MDSFYFEERRKEYLKLSSKEKSARILLFELISFLEELLSQENDLLKEVYVLETISDLIPLLEIYSVNGVEPNKINSLLDTSEKLTQFIDEEESKYKIEKQIQRIKAELKSLELMLDGNFLKHEGSSLSFPVLERTNYNINAFGMIEQLEILIHSNRNNKLEFNLIPSLPKIEESLKRQIDNSWKFAIEYLKSRHKKIKSNFVVTIKFVNKLGIYEGDSLGVALTVGFIQELFKYYDLREEISFENNIIATGSMTEAGEIGAVGEEIIKAKVETSFYSLGEILLVPQKDLDSADKKHKELQARYPKRKLRVIPINIIDDVINRRDVLNIHKQNIALWGSRKVIKHKLSLAMLILLIGTILGFYYVNQDDNPVNVEIVNGKYLIKNIKNQVLWSCYANPNLEYIQGSGTKIQLTPRTNFRIIDINLDGENEVLLRKYGQAASLALFDKKGNEIWDYTHYDSIRTKTELFSGVFNLNGIIDTIYNNNKLEIIAYFQHHNYYPNCILRIDALTGKKVGRGFYHSGGITGAILKDFNNDGKKEIIACGVSNGMHRAFLFSMDIDDNGGTFPTDENYYFKGMSLSNFNNYLLFPQTDLDQLYFNKYNGALDNPIIRNDQISLWIHGGGANIYRDYKSVYSVEMDQKFIPKNIVVGDQFANDRDQLVKNGILNYPLTDTYEYRKILLDQIEYWDGEKFVKFSNL